MARKGKEGFAVGPGPSSELLGYYRLSLRDSGGQRRCRNGGGVFGAIGRVVPGFEQDRGWRWRQGLLPCMSAQVGLLTLRQSVFQANARVRSGLGTPRHLRADAWGSGASAFVPWVTCIRRSCTPANIAGVAPDSIATAGRSLACGGDPLLRPSHRSGLRRGLVKARAATTTVSRADAWGSGASSFIPWVTCIRRSCTSSDSAGVAPDSIATAGRSLACGGDPLLRPSHRSGLRRGLVMTMATTTAVAGCRQPQQPLRRPAEAGTRTGGCRTREYPRTTPAKAGTTNTR